MEDPVGTRLGEGETSEEQGSDEHHRADGLYSWSATAPSSSVWGAWGAYKVPVRAMGGDANVGVPAIDRVVTVGDDSVVHTLVEHLDDDYCDFEGWLRRYELSVS